MQYTYIYIYIFIIITIFFLRNNSTKNIKNSTYRSSNCRSILYNIHIYDPHLHQNILQLIFLSNHSYFKS